jgi:hypothetical protein
LARGRKASCLQDHIYAYYQMFVDLGYTLPAPDISRPAKDISRDFTYLEIDNRKSLRVLEDVVSETRMPGLPSWVPDWSQECLSTMKPEVLVGSGKQPYSLHKRLQENPNGLRTRGLQYSWVTKAAKVSLKIKGSLPVGEWIKNDLQTFEAWKDLMQVLAEWFRVVFEAQRIKNPSLKHLRSSDFPGFLRSNNEVDESASITMFIEFHNLTNSLLGRRQAELHAQESLDVMMMVIDFHKVEKEPVPPLPWTTSVPVCSNLWARLKNGRGRFQRIMIILIKASGEDWVNLRLFWSEKDVMGATVGALQQQDIIVLLAGARLPMLVRPVDLSKRYFHLVGPAAVTSVIDGVRERKSQDEELEDFILV